PSAMLVVFSPGPEDQVGVDENKAGCSASGRAAIARIASGRSTRPNEEVRAETRPAPATRTRAPSTGPAGCVMEGAARLTGDRSLIGALRGLSHGSSGGFRSSLLEGFPTGAEAPSEAGQLPHPESRDGGADACPSACSRLPRTARGYLKTLASNKDRPAPTPRDPPASPCYIA